MSNESSKTKSYFTREESAWFFGRGIDIGCGNDPITPDCRRFDQNDGDANHICSYVNERFNWVFSSHCLEHMLNPFDALREWGMLLLPGGYLMVTVPDEDLYEQGKFPSIYNGDHKHTFTLSKRVSWSPVSVNMLELAMGMTDFRLVRLELHDMGYDRTLRNVDQTRGAALAQIFLVVRKNLEAPEVVSDINITI